MSHFLLNSQNDSRKHPQLTRNGTFQAKFSTNAREVGTAAHSKSSNKAIRECQCLEIVPEIAE